MRPRDDRSKLLALLSTKRYVPIDEIAAVLGLSVAASRIVISRLRRRGVGIAVLHGVGYRLDPSLDGVPTPPKHPVEPDAGTLGDAVRARRKRAGLSQGDLSLQAGIAPSMLSRIESNERIPDRSIVESLANVLGLGVVERDRLMVLGGYCPSSLLKLDPKRLGALLTLANVEAAA